eukprot:7551484-Ditylum_brightwellii.AAC.1
MMQNHLVLQSQSTNPSIQTQQMVTPEQQKHPTAAAYQNSVGDSNHQMTHQVMNLFVERTVPQINVMCNGSAQQRVGLIMIFWGGMIKYGTIFSLQYQQIY